MAHSSFALRDNSSIAQYSGLSRESNALNLLVQSSLRRICDNTPFSGFAGERAELRRRNTALGSRLIGGSDFQDYVFFAGLGPKDQREGKTRRRQSGRRVVGSRNISLFIGTQREDRIVNRGHVTSRDKDFCDAGERTHAQLTANVAARFGLRSQSDLPGRKRVVDPHDGVEMIFVD